jgi:hypothetical protein
LTVLTTQSTGRHSTRTPVRFAIENDRFDGSI